MRALLDHTSLGGALIGIGTVMKAGRACVYPALTLRGFPREGGGEGRQVATEVEVEDRN